MSVRPKTKETKPEEKLSPVVKEQMKKSEQYFKEFEADLKKKLLAESKPKQDLGQSIYNDLKKELEKFYTVYNSVPPDRGIPLCEVDPSDGRYYAFRLQYEKEIEKIKKAIAKHLMKYVLA